MSVRMKINIRPINMANDRMIIFIILYFVEKSITSLSLYAKKIVKIIDAKSNINNITIKINTPFK